jgi:hypothetical protein
MAQRVMAAVGGEMCRARDVYGPTSCVRRWWMAASGALRLLMRGVIDFVVVMFILV